ncbi:MAG: cytochrome c oxidase subunit 2A [Brevibacillus sp.]|nr:cytochrome c oxidase subunit 2A [Brevibacillus sp.]
MVVQPGIPQPDRQHPQTERKDSSLKGTFAAVLLLGAFIVVCWFAVFSLFVSRG